MRTFLENTVIVVLDDDPTGTQTVHDVPVLTTWEEDTLEEMFRTDTPLFYILTNSRAFSEEVAVAMNEEIGGRLKKLGDKYQRRVLPISRSDSTLRGHYPAEVNALGKGFGATNPLVFIIPAFIEGGRVTVDGVHYLEQEGVRTPVSETPFAKDPVFGYANSDLTEWVVEKAAGTIRHEQIKKVGRADLTGAALAETANRVVNPAHKVVVTDAESYEDLARVADLIRRVQELGRDVIIRSAASIVKTLGNLEAAPLLEASDLLDVQNERGGLVVVGSFVPLTTRQVSILMDRVSLPAYIINTKQVVADPEEYVATLASKVREHIESGETVLVYTQRKLQTGANREENIQIGMQYSDLLVKLVQQIDVPPAFVVAKGGITSSDIATKGLGIRKAMVKGQIIPGVSVWEPGADSRLSGFPYVVFPGNVGNDQALYEVVKKLLGNSEL
ncbi:MAG: hypothetical protein KKG00_16425 [Bacteroidetes bacterium]|nr:hypothetical protein [Bacteroidota bacterium]